MWRNINGYGGKYQVSSCGEIRNAWTGRVLRLTTGKNGYKSVVIRPDGRSGGSRCLRVHRVVAEAWVDGYFEGAVVNHRDGVKINNFAENLEWVTCSENVQHAYMIGLANRGSGLDSISCRLDRETVISIFRDTRPHRVIAEEYLVGKTTVQNIKSGRRYSDITGF